MAYATVAQLRALDGLSDATAYPDATLEEGIAWAEHLIDTYTGTSFEAKAFTVTVDAPNSYSLTIPVLFPRTLTACAVDGVAVSPAGWVLYPEGVILRPDGTPFLGYQVTLSGTAGYSTTVPPDVAWAARTLARQYAIDLHSRIPDRALSVQSDFGNIPLAQAGGPGRPTSLPDINAVLNRNRHRPPAAG